MDAILGLPHPGTAIARDKFWKVTDECAGMEGRGFNPAVSLALSFRGFNPWGSGVEFFCILLRV